LYFFLPTVTGSAINLDTHYKNQLERIVHDNRLTDSSSVSNIDLENNNIHDNVDYGLDPHLGTNNVIIRNNTVYDNGKMGIICSNECTNIIIESNRVYNNVGSGIALSINMRHSTVRNNIVFNQTNAGDMEERYNGISISESSNNMIYNNRISNNDIGIDVRNNSSDNYINDNYLTDINSYAIHVKSSDSLNNVFAGNYIDTSNHIVGINNNTGSLFTSNSIGIIKEAEYSVEKNSILHLENVPT
jgi:parallel beta-helix repeat protein